jgi:hypothetical protein
VSEDDQIHSSQGRYFHPTQNGGRPQRREQGKSHPAMAASASNPFYDYVQEQKSCQN